MGQIYQIRNIVNDKRYIGSSVNYKSRWKNHRGQLNGGVHHSKYLQRAWNKYGIKSFIFEIIEDSVEDVKLIKVEQIYLDSLLNANIDDSSFYLLGYNLCRIAGSMLGFKFSNESKKKLSKLKSGKNNPMYGRRGKDNPNYGSKRSKSTIQKMKNAQSLENNPMYGKHGKDNPTSKVLLQYKNGKFIKRWNSLTECVKALKYSGGNISSCCKGALKTHKGYSWKYEGD